MSKVLIAAGVIGWSVIALVTIGCSSNSNSRSDTSNPNLSQNINLAPMAVAEQTAPSEKRHRSATIVASSAVPSVAPVTTPDVKVPTVSSPSVVPVPDVNPLNSITQLARQPATNLSKAELKSGSSNDSNPQTPIADDVRPPDSQEFGNIATRPNKYRSGNNKLDRQNTCKSFPCLILSQSPSHPHNKFNNPIYKLTAYRDKTASSTFQLDAVTGRGFTQTRNRYRSQTEAPLPDGSYSIAARVVAGTLVEVGGTMVPIFPKPGFDRRMSRSALGIHWDPSFNKDKKEDGTSGCIGLTSKRNYYQVRDFILKYHPRSLEVQIDN
jgi:hypothetical protein